jgi:hypothetical protein
VFKENTGGKVGVILMQVGENRKATEDPENAMWSRLGVSCRGTSRNGSIGIRGDS